ncbi:peptidase MA family metallohydrolase [Clostridium folliculivorans]|uniref:Peptidase MA-like domain-containing protein n=1 Tax=Clostridium folliculivorans TaxID=2886038 RepID=A0A9W6DAK1_9CLOT|nr:hypothetical protein [Clostridium folliculivorans]GKU25051.1 hypothetical protein CFOLD11_18770 [Clostridium folliculivorans]GKU31149.1 hypothetical protein CFB3_32560 [Clostridium folliculivorans]
MNAINYEGNKYLFEELKELDEKDENKLNLRVKTEHFIVYFRENDSKCMGKVIDALENNYSRITINLDQKLQSKLIIEIYSNIKSLHHALGLQDAPTWIRGGLGAGKIIIASPLNPPPGSNFDNVVNTAIHEFVHILVNKINNNTPRWLNEGIACYEAKDNNESWIRQTVSEGLSNGKIPTFKDLDTGEDFETFFALNGYQYSYTMVEAIINLFGYDKLRRFVRSPNKFDEVLNISKTNLYMKYIDYIRENY